MWLHKCFFLWRWSLFQKSPVKLPLTERMCFSHMTQYWCREVSFPPLSLRIVRIATNWLYSSRRRRLTSAMNFWRSRNASPWWTLKLMSLKRKWMNYSQKNDWWANLVYVPFVAGFLLCLAHSFICLVCVDRSFLMGLMGVGGMESIGSLWVLY